MNPIIFNKYKIIEQIGTGSFGEVYKGINIRTQEEVAIKREKMKNILLLKNEASIYKYLGHQKGFLDFKWYGNQNDNLFLVSNLLDESLSSVKKKQVFALTAVKQIGLQIIQRLEVLHKHNLIHRDVKPDNFLFGKQDKKHTLYIIDLGFCKKYRLENGDHIPFKLTTNIIGSINYISLNVHYKSEPSRRDDLESVMYILLYLLDLLPWVNDSRQKEVNVSDIIEQKTVIVSSPEIPFFIKQLLVYIRKLSFEETPDYSYIKREFE